MPISRRNWLATLVASGISVLGTALHAQSPRLPIQTSRLPDDAPNKVPETEVSLELIASAAAATEHAQAWGQRLQKLGVAFQTRQPIVGDQLSIKEQKLGRIRKVTVVASLDRNGKIVCHDRSFTLAEADKLAEWVRELKTYGAQGAPHGKPLFGLDERQFARILRELSPMVNADVEGLSLDDALIKLPLPAKHRLRKTPEAERAIAKIDPDRKLRINPRSLSVGTVLAAILNEFGLIFKPLRAPDGQIELAVFPRDAGQDAWPVGWPLESEKPQGQIVPNLFKMVPVELKDAPLPDVLTAASQASEVPLLVDHYAIELEGIDLGELKVTVPSRKTTWGLLLRQITAPHKLGRKIVTDEVGRPFVLITTLKESLKESAATKRN